MNSMGIPPENERTRTSYDADALRGLSALGKLSIVNKGVKDLLERVASEQQIPKHVESAPLDQGRVSKNAKFPSLAKIAHICNKIIGRPEPRFRESSDLHLALMDNKTEDSDIRKMIETKILTGECLHKENSGAWAAFREKYPTYLNDIKAEIKAKGTHDGSGFRTGGFQEGLRAWTAKKKISIDDVPLRILREILLKYSD